MRVIKLVDGRPVDGPQMCEYTRRVQPHGREMAVCTKNATWIYRGGHNILVYVCDTHRAVLVINGHTGELTWQAL